MVENIQLQSIQDFLLELVLDAPGIREKKVYLQENNPQVVEAAYWIQGRLVTLFAIPSSQDDRESIARYVREYVAENKLQLRHGSIRLLTGQERIG